MVGRNEGFVVERWRWMIVVKADDQLMVVKGSL